MVMYLLRTGILKWCVKRVKFFNISIEKCLVVIENYLSRVARTPRPESVIAGKVSQLRTTLIELAKNQATELSNGHQKYNFPDSISFLGRICGSFNQASKLIPLF